MAQSLRLTWEILRCNRSSGGSRSHSTILLESRLSFSVLAVHRHDDFAPTERRVDQLLTHRCRTLA